MASLNAKVLSGDRCAAPKLKVQIEFYKMRRVLKMSQEDESRTNNDSFSLTHLIWLIEKFDLKGNYLIRDPAHSRVDRLLDTRCLFDSV